MANGGHFNLSSQPCLSTAGRHIGTSLVTCILQVCFNWLPLSLPNSTWVEVILVTDYATRIKARYGDQAKWNCCCCCSCVPPVAVEETTIAIHWSVPVLDGRLCQARAIVVVDKRKQLVLVGELGHRESQVSTSLQCHETVLCTDLANVIAWLKNCRKSKILPALFNEWSIHSWPSSNSWPRALTSWLFQGFLRHSL